MTDNLTDQQREIEDECRSILVDLKKHWDATNLNPKDLAVVSNVTKRVANILVVNRKG